MYYVLCKGRNMEDLRYTTVEKVERKRDGWMACSTNHSKEESFLARFWGGSHPSI